MFDKFIESVSKFGKLENSDINYLRDHSKIVTYKKGETIVPSRKIVRNICFLLDGCIRLFYNVNGKNKTAFFYDEGDFILDCNKLAAQKNYEAIEDTVVVIIDKLALNKLLNTSTTFEMIILKVKELDLYNYQQLAANFITLSPEERFMKLLETNKPLFQKVPQQYIATYLGISAETLSRIKKRVFKKQREILYC
ncbi:MAG: Crp/Fnr family transcriptional regulator [Marinilabiliales bacterium]|nr:MAG: Crp/Fnr family transcriptional regulator [Marinilabiliales bacterium]